MPRTKRRQQAPTRTPIQLLDNGLPTLDGENSLELERLHEVAPEPPGLLEQLGQGQHYDHLDVTTGMMELDEDGVGFVGRSKEEYDRIALELEQQDLPHSDRDVRFEMMSRRVREANGRRELGGEGTLGVFTAPEWSLGKNLTKEDVEDYRLRFGQLSQECPDMVIMPGTMLWQERRKKRNGLGKKTVMHNEGDVFHGGGLVHSVNKHCLAGDDRGVVSRHGQGGEVDRERATKWYRRGGYNDEGSTQFDIGNVHFGYEICGDTSEVRTRKELFEEGDGRVLPQVQVVNSTGQAPTRENAPLREGGIALGSDGGSGTGQVWTSRDEWVPEKTVHLTPEEIAERKRVHDPVPTERYGNGLEVEDRQVRSLGNGEGRLGQGEVDLDHFLHEHRGRFGLPG